MLYILPTAKDQWYVTVCSYCLVIVCFVLLYSSVHTCAACTVCSGLLDVARRTYTETVDDIAGTLYML